MKPTFLQIKDFCNYKLTYQLEYSFSFYKVMHHYGWFIKRRLPSGQRFLQGAFGQSVYPATFSLHHLLQDWLGAFYQWLNLLVTSTWNLACGFRPFRKGHFSLSCSWSKDISTKSRHSFNQEVEVMELFTSHKAVKVSTSIMVFRIVDIFWIIAFWRENVWAKSIRK